MRTPVVVIQRDVQQWIVKNLPLLGDLRLAQGEYSQYSSRYPAFCDCQVLPAFDRAMGGGALLDLGIYTLHFVVGLLGRPWSIRYTANTERGVGTSGDTETIHPKIHQHRMVEGLRAFERMIRSNDFAQRDTRLDHSLLVLELATEGLNQLAIELRPGC